MSETPATTELAPDLESELRSKLRAHNRIVRIAELTLYGAVTVLAALVAVDAQDITKSPTELIAIAWAANVAIALAHAFAYTFSRRITAVDHVQFGSYRAHILRTWPVMLAAPAATLGVLIPLVTNSSLDAAERGADIALVALCTGVTMWAGSIAGVPMRRRLLLALFIAVAVGAVANVKAIFGH